MSVDDRLRLWHKKFPYVTYTKDQRLGSGSFASVYFGKLAAFPGQGRMARWPEMDVAVKVAIETIQTNGTFVDFMRELSMMARLNHPGILVPVAWGLDSSNQYVIATERMARDLRQVLDDCERGLAPANWNDSTKSIVPTESRSPWPTSTISGSFIAI
jgi:serine/threonine protein kinase